MKFAFYQAIAIVSCIGLFAVEAQAKLPAATGTYSKPVTNSDSPLMIDPDAPPISQNGEEAPPPTYTCLFNISPNPNPSSPTVYMDMTRFAPGITSQTRVVRPTIVRDPQQLLRNAESIINGAPQNTGSCHWFNALRSDGVRYACSNIAISVVATPGFDAASSTVSCD